MEILYQILQVFQKLLHQFNTAGISNITTSNTAGISKYCRYFKYNYIKYCMGFNYYYMYIFDTVFMIHVDPRFVVGILGDQLEGL